MVANKKLAQPAEGSNYWENRQPHKKWFRFISLCKQNKYYNDNKGSKNCKLANKQYVIKLSGKIIIRLRTI